MKTNLTALELLRILFFRNQESDNNTIKVLKTVLNFLDEEQQLIILSMLVGEYEEPTLPLIVGEKTMVKFDPLRTRDEVSYQYTETSTRWFKTEERALDYSKTGGTYYGKTKKSDEYKFSANYTFTRLSSTSTEKWLEEYNKIQEDIFEMEEATRQLQEENFPQEYDDTMRDQL